MPLPTVKSVQNPFQLYPKPELDRAVAPKSTTQRVPDHLAYCRIGEYNFAKTTLSDKLFYLETKRQRLFR